MPLTILLLVIAACGVRLATVPTPDALAEREYAYLDKVPQRDPGFRSRREALDTAEISWRKVERQMRKLGCTDREVRGVLNAARRHFSVSAGRTRTGYLITYGAPVYARREWVRWEPVWAIGFGWGVVSDDSKGGAEPPTHHRVLIIQARPPHRALAMLTCG